jgi:hypothetical protein
MITVFFQRSFCEVETGTEGVALDGGLVDRVEPGSAEPIALRFQSRDLLSCF